jgi:two-component system chemotaxis response regulator CheY
MKTLIVEDDFTSRLVMQGLLKKCSNVIHTAVNGKEALDAFCIALEAGEPYDLICLDIMMPEMDGLEALKHFRALEEEKGIELSEGVKILMTTALSDVRNVMTAYNNLCNGYLTKPVAKAQFFEELRKLDLIQ